MFYSKCSFLIVSTRKNSKIFPCGFLFSCVLDEIFIGVPKFHETSPALKYFWLHTRYFSTKSVLFTACTFTKRKMFYLTICFKDFKYKFTEKPFSQGYLWMIDQKKYRKTLPLPYLWMIDQKKYRKTLPLIICSASGCLTCLIFTCFRSVKPNFIFIRLKPIR